MNYKLQLTDSYMKASIFYMTFDQTVFITQFLYEQFIQFLMNKEHAFYEVEAWNPCVVMVYNTYILVGEPGNNRVSFQVF